MEWIERLNRAINYIEEHIIEEINLDQVAKVASCSTYHFHRMFAYMADVPLSEYIRRRRMSLAAVDLQDGEQKIIDIALKYGYTSPTAFNRAFQSIHGVAPSLLKEGGIALRAFPPISFKITNAPDIEVYLNADPQNAMYEVWIPVEKSNGGYASFK